MRRRVTAPFLFFSSLALRCIEYNVSSIELMTGGPLTFGGLIGWRANKQDTVTTSTTEAELLALAQAAKESLYVSRLLTELSVKFEDKTIRI